jgi:hypothetical protein
MLDFLCALVTVMAAAAFAQFGVTLETKPGANAAASNPEVHRTVEGGVQGHGQLPSMKAAAHAVRLPAPAVPSVGRKGG